MTDIHEGYRMKLTSVRVTNYKSIDDSTEFTVGDLTCLAGKNESGKTAILQALRRLNPVETSERLYNRDMELPRARLYEAGSDGKEQVLVTKWQLTDDDVAAVEAMVGKGSLTDRTVTISKGYVSGGKTWGVN